jgi:hypothetical protein
MVTLPTVLYICSYFNSQMALYYFILLFCRQLRADYIRGQVYQGAGVSLIRE